MTEVQAALCECAACFLLHSYPYPSAISYIKANYWAANNHALASPPQKECKRATALAVSHLSSLTCTSLSLSWLQLPRASATTGARDKDKDRDRESHLHGSFHPHLTSCLVAELEG